MPAKERFRWNVPPNAKASNRSIKHNNDFWSSDPCNSGSDSESLVLYIMPQEGIWVHSRANWDVVLDEWIKLNSIEFEIKFQERADWVLPKTEMIIYINLFQILSFVLYLWVISQIYRLLLRLLLALFAYVLLLLLLQTMLHFLVKGGKP